MNFIKMLEAILPPDITTGLDIGCGLCRVLRWLPINFKVGIDIWRPYLEKAQKDTAGNIVLINADVKQIPNMFLENSFDVVTMTDIVEHFKKKVAIQLIRDAETIARRQVLIFTPRGYDPQTEDVLGMGGTKYQEHRSEWEQEEFTRLGYKTLLLEKFHKNKGIDAIIAYKDMGAA